MPRLPIPGSDDGTWGNLLNDFLDQSHNPDGTLRDGVVADSHISTVSQSKIIGLSADLASKEQAVVAGNAAQYYRGDKTWQTLNAQSVGLSNVDNTSDANKPISLATQTALNLKVDASVATTKGDILAATSSATIARVPVGTNGRLLAADSNQATGLVWDSESAVVARALGWVVVQGLVSDDTTDNWATLQTAINNAPDGSTVYVPAGRYRISRPLDLTGDKIYNFGWNHKWTYYPAQNALTAWIKPHTSFSGNAVVRVQSRYQSGSAEDNWGGTIQNLCIDVNSKTSVSTLYGGLAGSGVAGLLFDGDVRDWTVEDVTINQAAAHSFWARLNITNGDAFPRGMFVRNVTAYSAGTTTSPNYDGFKIDQVTDSRFFNCSSDSAGRHGWNINGGGALTFVGCRGLFSGDKDLFIDGLSSVGGHQFDSFTSDRAGGYGVRVGLTHAVSSPSSNAPQPVVFTNLLIRGAGQNNGAGVPNSGGPQDPGDANLAIRAEDPTPDRRVVPVYIYGLMTTANRKDGVTTGSAYPSKALHISNASTVVIRGSLGATTTSVDDDGSSYSVDLAGCVQVIGDPTAVVAPTVQPLSYTPVNIYGSATATRAWVLSQVSGGASFDRYAPRLAAGTNNPAETSVALPVGTWGWALLDTNTYGVRFTADVPSSWATYDIFARWTPGTTPAAAGEVNFQLFYQQSSAGTILGSETTPGIMTDVSAASSITANQVYEMKINSTPIAAPDGQAFSARVNRSGLTDTYTGTVYLLEVLIVRVT